ncbi:acylneuraminate cytidylyltransferase [Streptomyces sp. AJS327]|uniref:acylneuraminate cytidylyltransferase n=1 Tax=Streptomyces sp. AJS327 TaxID=2545265 RepID=UPI0027E53AF3|nr:acylneuraminate cytidylyltransferase [Streptomyces sp. AJS327]
MLAVIPARGGSKGVPGKNLAEVGGVPLVARAVRACHAARRVTGVLVSTDDPAIAAVARAEGARVVERPARLAGDLATSEAAVLHALEWYATELAEPVDAVLLVQCTSPFVTATELDAVAGALADGADSALTVAPFHGFVWRAAPAHATTPPDPSTPGNRRDRPGDPAPVNRPATPTRSAPLTGGHGVNHDAAHRPRRQDRPEDLLETGAVYGMDAAGFRAARHRFFGRVEPVRTDPARTLEIDDPHDLARARALAPLLDAQLPGDADRSGQYGPPDDPVDLGRSGSSHHPEARPRREDVDAVILDFDGTQTDDRVYLDADGRELVAVHRGDGLGIAALRRSGLELLVLSTEQNPVVAVRARKLGLPVLHGVDRKDLALTRWCAERGIPPERVLYLGNDVNDLPCLRLVGWPVAVADAHRVVRRAARAVTGRPGGHGAVREVASWVLGATL